MNYEKIETGIYRHGTSLRAVAHVKGKQITEYFNGTSKYYLYKARRWRNEMKAQGQAEHPRNRDWIPTTKRKKNARRSKDLPVGICDTHTYRYRADGSRVKIKVISTIITNGGKYVKTFSSWYGTDKTRTREEAVALVLSRRSTFEKEYFG